MSTRCNIIVRDLTENYSVVLYHHHDGYIQGVGAELLDVILSHGEAMKSADDIVAHLQNTDAEFEISGRVENTTLGGESFCSGDIEYLYTITIKHDTKFGKYDIAVSAKEVDFDGRKTNINGYGCQFVGAWCKEIRPETKSLSDYSDEELLEEMKRRLTK